MLRLSKTLRMFIISCFVMLFIGCASNEPQIKEIKKRLEALDAEYNNLVNEYVRLKDVEMVAIKDNIQKNRVKIRWLSMQLDRLSGVATTGGDNSKITDKEMQDKKMKEQLERLLVKLRIDENYIALAPQFRVIGKPAVLELVKLLLNEDIDLKTRAEKILGEMSPDLVVPEIENLLSIDSPVKIIAIRIIGDLGSKDYTMKILSFLSSNDDEVRFYAAEALVKMQVKRGIPVLIEYLDDDSDTKRAISYDTLVKYTGMTFDYKYYLEKDKRARSIEKWKNWWDSVSLTFEFNDNEGKKKK